MIEAAILIDGGYFLKKLPHSGKDIDLTNPSDVVQSISQLIRGHLEQFNKNWHKNLFLNFVLHICVLSRRQNVSGGWNDSDLLRLRRSRKSNLSVHFIPTALPQSPSDSRNYPSGLYKSRVNEPTSHTRG